MLASRERIVLDNKLMHGLGYDDTRSFFAALGNWGYNTDFNTIAGICDTDTQAYLRAFVRSFLD